MAAINEALPGMLFPVIVPLTSILAVDDVAQVPVLEALVIEAVSGAVRLLTSGTLTLVVKNNAGGTLATVAVTVAATVTAGTVSIAAVAAGDRIRIGMSGVGIGAVDAAVTLWCRWKPRL